MKKEKEDEIVKQAMSILAKRRSPENVGRRAVPITCPINGCGVNCSGIVAFRGHLRDFHGVHFRKVLQEGRTFLPPKVIAENLRNPDRRLGKRKKSQQF